MNFVNFLLIKSLLSQEQNAPSPDVSQARLQSYSFPELLHLYLLQINKKKGDCASKVNGWQDNCSWDEWY